MRDEKRKKESKLNFQLFFFVLIARVKYTETKNRTNKVFLEIEAQIREEVAREFLYVTGMFKHLDQSAVF